MHLPRVLAQANNFHRCSAACPPRSVVLRWRPEQAAACLQGCPELHSQLYQACDEPGEAGAGFLLAFMMECAARHDSVRDGRWCPDARCPLAISPTRCAAAGIRRTQRAIDLQGALVDDELRVLGSCVATNAFRMDPRFSALPFTDIRALMSRCDRRWLCLCTGACVWWMMSCRPSARNCCLCVCVLVYSCSLQAGLRWKCKDDDDDDYMNVLC
jgi:hypothetical protein